MKTCTIALSLALLTSTALTQSSPLSFKTSDALIAAKFALKAQWELPDLEQGMHWEFVLDDRGQMEVRTQQGEVRIFECTARPGDFLRCWGFPCSSAWCGSPS